MSRCVLDEDMAHHVGMLTTAFGDQLMAQLREQCMERTLDMQRTLVRSYVLWAQDGSVHPLAKHVEPLKRQRNPNLPSLDAEPMLLLVQQEGVGGPVLLCHTSGNYRTRIANLQMGSPHVQVLLGAIRGPVQLKHALAADLEPMRIRGVWFDRRAADLLDVFAGNPATPTIMDARKYAWSPDLDF